MLRFTFTRARGFSRITLAVYTAVLVLLSFAHHCEVEDPAHAAGEHSHGLHFFQSGQADVEPGHSCFACAWHRSTPAPPLLGPNRISEAPRKAEAHLPSVLPLLRRCWREHTSRGPPSS